MLIGYWNWTWAILLRNLTKHTYRDKTNLSGQEQIYIFCKFFLLLTEVIIKERNGNHDVGYLIKLLLNLFYQNSESKLSVARLISESTTVSIQVYIHEAQ